MLLLPLLNRPTPPVLTHGKNSSIWTKAGMLLHCFDWLQCSGGKQACLLPRHCDCSHIPFPKLHTKLTPTTHSTVAPCWGGGFDWEAGWLHSESPDFAHPSRP